MYKQLFEIEGELLGETERTREIRTAAAPFSMAYFCPKCARIWARCPVEKEPWMVTTVTCKACGKLSLISIPGSIWRALDDEFNEALPRAVLLRELSLHLEWYDKYFPKEEVWVQTTTQNQEVSTSTLQIPAPDLSAGPNPFAGLRRL